MEILSKKSVASVEILETEISIDELNVYEAALSFTLEKLADAEIENRFGATREEIEGILDDVREAVSVCKESDLIAA